MFTVPFPLLHPPPSTQRVANPLRHGVLMTLLLPVFIATITDPHVLRLLTNNSTRNDQGASSYELSVLEGNPAG